MVPLPPVAHSSYDAADGKPEREGERDRRRAQGVRRSEPTSCSAWRGAAGGGRTWTMHSNWMTETFAVTHGCLLRRNVRQYRNIQVCIPVACDNHGRRRI